MEILGQFLNLSQPKVLNASLHLHLDELTASKLPLDLGGSLCYTTQSDIATTQALGRCHEPRTKDHYSE